jgi:hypothetical protein
MSTEKSILGASRHLLYIGKKNGKKTPSTNQEKAMDERLS